MWTPSCPEGNRLTHMITSLSAKVHPVQECPVTFCSISRGRVYKGTGILYASANQYSTIFRLALVSKMDALIRAILIVITRLVLQAGINAAVDNLSGAKEQRDLETPVQLDSQLSGIFLHMSTEERQNLCLIFSCEPHPSALI